MYVYCQSSTYGHQMVLLAMVTIACFVWWRYRTGTWHTATVFVTLANQSNAVGGGSRYFRPWRSGCFIRLDNSCGASTVNEMVRLCVGKAGVGKATKTEETHSAYDIHGPQTVLRLATSGI
jgi:hypothetical protein